MKKTFSYKADKKFNADDMRQLDKFMISSDAFFMHNFIYFYKEDHDHHKVLTTVTHLDTDLIMK